MPETIKRTTGTKVAFGDVVQLSKERSKDPEADGFERYIGLEHLEPSDLKVRSWGDLADGVTFTNVFRPGQVLFGKRRAYQRKVAVADFSGVCSGDIYALEPKGEQLLPELLPFICQSEPFYDYVISMSQGGLSPRVNWKALAKYEFALPPLEEQRRIAEVLQAASSSIETLINLKSGQDRCIEAGLKKIFSDLDAPVVAIGDVAHRVTNGFVGSAVKHYVDEGIPYLRSLNVRRTGVDLSDLIYISEPFHEKTKKSQLAEGDLLTVQSGHVGETAVVPAECSDWNCHALIVTKLKRDVAVPAYVSMYLNSLVGQRELSRYYVGSTVLHLNTSDLARLEIPMPGIKEQSRISEYRLTAQRALKSINTRIEEARLLQQALLSEALQGCSEIT